MNVRRFIFALSLLTVTALADEVNIEWGKVEGTFQYQLQIKRKNTVVLAKEFPAERTTWTGDLPFGEYVYRIRSVTPDGTAGEWSEPTPFFVTPGTPQLLLPINRSTILFSSARETAFRWTPVRGIASFALEIQSEGGKTRREIVSEPRAVVSGLPPGNFSWRVVPLLKNKTGRLQSLGDKASPQWNFRIEGDEDNNSPDLDANRVRLSLPAGSSGLANGEVVCLLEKLKPPVALGCGKVIELSPSFAVVRLKKAIPNLIDGKEYPVARKRVGETRQPSSTPVVESYIVSLERKRFNFDLGGGVVAGTQLLLFSLHGRAAIGGGLALGLRGVFAGDRNTTESAQLTGIFGTVSYYFSRRNFSGFFGEAGAGGYLYNVTKGAAEEKGRFSASGYAVAGWQFRPSLWNFSLSTALGAQYVARPNITITEVSLSGLVPTLMLNASFAF